MVTEGDAGKFQAIGEDDLKVDIRLVLEVRTDADDDLVAKENEIEEHNRQQHASVTNVPVPSHVM